MTLTTQPIFLLTCMRSYSSLVSSMLGQHSQLFVLPEVNLFVAPTLGEAADLFRAIRPRSLDGVHRLVAELEFGGQDFDTIKAAGDWLKARRDWTPVDFMAWVTEKVAPRRVIEKSPSTVVKDGGIEMALRLFPQADYLHLTRHPVATCDSIARITNYADLKGPRKRFVKDPEMSWLEINSAILDTSRSLSAAQYMCARGEDVLSDPDGFLAQLCDWLGLELTEADVEAIYHPENSPFACYGPQNAPFGNDPNFLKNPSFKKRPITTPTLEAELTWAPEEGRYLMPESLLLAQQLGYTDGERFG